MTSTMKINIDLYLETIKKGDIIFFSDGTYQVVEKYKKGSHQVAFKNGNVRDLYVLEDSIERIVTPFDKGGKHTSEFISIAIFAAVIYLTLNCKYHAYLDVLKAFLIGDEEHYISDYCKQSQTFGILKDDDISEEDIGAHLTPYEAYGFIKQKLEKHNKPYYYTRKDKKRWHRELVWYVAYGSNMCKERFMCYITGDSCQKYFLKKGEPCEDQSPVIGVMSIKIPYEMYFGNQSKTWNNRGVAFIRPTKDKNKYSFARAYLITKQQYEHIWKREGKTPNWYGEEIILDMPGDIPFKTFTSKVEHQYNAPSGIYIEVVRKGLMEWGLSYLKANQYLFCKTDGLDKKVK